MLDAPSIGTINAATGAFTAVAAGIFDGGLRSTIPEHHQRRYTDASALSRIGDPVECGELVAWLISKRNTYMTGSVIFLDGGTLG